MATELLASQLISATRPYLELVARMDGNTFENASYHSQVSRRNEGDKRKSFAIS